MYVPKSAEGWRLGTNLTISPYLRGERPHTLGQIRPKAIEPRCWVRLFIGKGSRCPPCEGDHCKKVRQQSYPQCRLRRTHLVCIIQVCTLITVAKLSMCCDWQSVERCLGWTRHLHGVHLHSCPYDESSIASRCIVA